MELTYKWISLANRYYYLYLNKRLASIGINASQYLFIIISCREPGLAQDKFTDRVFVDKSNIARGLSQLEKMGFVERIINELDRRSVNVYPTNKAYNIYPHIMEIIEDWDRAVMGSFSDEEKSILKRQLAKVTDVSCAFLKMYYQS